MSMNGNGIVQPGPLKETWTASLIDGTELTEDGSQVPVEVVQLDVFSEAGHFVHFMSRQHARAVAEHILDKAGFGRIVRPPAGFDPERTEQ